MFLKLFYYIRLNVSMLQDLFYHVETGYMTGDKTLNANMMYVSKDGRKKWIPLHKFVFVSKNEFLNIV